MLELGWQVCEPTLTELVAALETAEQLFGDWELQRGRDFRELSAHVDRGFAAAELAKVRTATNRLWRHSTDQ